MRMCCVCAGSSIDRFCPIVGVRYSGAGNGWHGGNAITVDRLGNIYITGWSRGLNISFDFATVKYLPIAIEESTIANTASDFLNTIIFRGPLQLPAGRKCGVYDITGRIAEPTNIAPGIYFLEIDNKIVQKVVKVR